MKLKSLAGLALIVMSLVACGAPASFDRPGGVAAYEAEPPTITPVEADQPTTGAVTPLATSTTAASPTPTSSPTATASPTETPVPSDTPTSVPTETPTATASPTATYPPPPEAVNVPILMYHYISEVPPDADIYRRDLTVTPARFEAQLQYLKEQGYESVTLADVYATLTEGKPLPERPVVLTFDDGYKDAYTHAVPLLQAYGFIGEFFVLATPAHYEAPQYLTWNDMRAMADAGMSIQAHARDHYDLTNRSYDFLVYQILGAREAVEAHTGQDVRFFCYPSGRHDTATESVVASAGYWGAVTTAWGSELRLDNRYAWPRIRVRGAWELAQFASALNSLE
ncbi:MAG: polysaccharide deacetylase family protein [Anaerolineae bacterium]